MEKYQKIPALYKFDNAKQKYQNEFSLPEIEFLANCPWYGTEKYDGTNIRVIWDGYEISYAGRTEKSQLPKEVIAALDNVFANAEVTFEQLFGEKEVILFMECYGGKVQGSKQYGWYNGCDESLMGFDIMINGKYLDRTQIKDIFNTFGMPSIDLVKFDNLYEAINFVKNYSGQNYFEGLVCTPLIPLNDNNNKRIIVKIKTAMFKKIENN